jgi:hypothetical protein
MYTDISDVVPSPLGAVVRSRHGIIQMPEQYASLLKETTAIELGTTHRSKSVKRNFNLSFTYSIYIISLRSLKINSRVILIDMGASLDFHGNIIRTSSPTYLSHPKTLNRFMQLLYPWINIPVVTVQDKAFRNPLEMVLYELEEDDLVFSQAPAVELQ